MKDQGPPAGHVWAPRFVLVVIEDETTQAMVCVALEQTGFQPVAVGAGEVAAVAAVLPRCPLAVVATAADGLADRFRPHRPARHGGGRREALPTLLIDSPSPAGARPRGRVEPPDLAAIVRAVEALAVV